MADQGYRTEWQGDHGPVGGDCNVPLGFISLTEKLFMIGMALWVEVKVFEA